MDNGILPQEVSVVGSRFIPMTSTHETAAPPVDVSGLDVRETLLATAAARRTADREEARLLVLAIQVVHLFPVTEDTCAATWNPSASLLADPEPVAGIGTPLVAEQAVEELGAALDVSYRSALGLVTDSLELCYRLPRLWALVRDGSLQAWKARKVAQETVHLSREAAAFVDRQAALAGAKNRIVPNLPGLVQEALVRFDPDTARAREEATQAHRDVRFDYHGDTLGSATLHATLDVVDAHDLDATVSDLANQMGRLGDQSPLGHRRAAALGLLAHPQRALDLFGQPAEGQQPKSLAITGATLYVHLTGDDLRRTAEDGETTPADIEKLGTATLTLLKEWLQRFSGITVKPVLDMSRSDAVDQHDPPEWMRDLVTLRDGHCVFPGCNVDARRCDHDHIDPYVAIGPGRTTRPNQPSQLGLPLQAAPPPQDLHELALRTRRPRHLRLDQPTRPHLRDPPHRQALTPPLGRPKHGRRPIMPMSAPCSRSRVVRSTWRAPRSVFVGRGSFCELRGRTHVGGEMTTRQPSDVSAYAEFVAARSTSLFRTAYLVIGDYQLAEDLLQESLVKVYVAWPRLHDPGKAEAYTRRIIVTTAISWRRRRSFHEPPTADLPETVVLDETERVTGHDELWSQLRLLPARQRAAVVLRFCEDLSEAQTAELMGCAVGTVKRQVSVALGKLREHLGADFVPPTPDPAVVTR